MNRSVWIETLLRPTAVAVMTGCLALSFVDMVHLFFPGWNGTVLVLGCVLAVLEANYSYRLLRSKGPGFNRMIPYRIAETALFFILLRIGTLATRSSAGLPLDVQSWLRQPWSLFLDLETGNIFLLVLASWLAATQTAQDMDRIGERPPVDHYYVPPIRRLTNRFFWGGAILLVTTGIARIGITSLLDLSRAPVRGLVLNVLVYFVLGLVMLGQTHYTRLHRRWQGQDLRQSPGLAGRWARLSLAFIGLVSLAAFLLPTSYTMGLLELVSTLFQGLFYILSLIWIFLVNFFLLLLTPLTKLMGRDPPESPRDLPPFEPSPAETGSAGGNMAWLAILRSLIFWAVALGTVIYVLRTFLRDRPELLETLASLRPIRALRSFLSALWRSLLGLVQEVRAHLPRRLLPRRRGRRTAARRRSLYFRRGARTPRERVLQDYLNLLDQAAGEGFPRQRAQTPHEYDAALGPCLPEAQPDMSALTQSFVEARYSRHAVEQEQADRAHSWWQRVREALRALRQKNGAAPHSSSEQR